MGSLHTFFLVLLCNLAVFFHSWLDSFSIGFLQPAAGADVMPEACQQDVLPAVLLEATHTSIVPLLADTLV